MRIQCLSKKIKKTDKIFLDFFEKCCIISVLLNVIGYPRLAFTALLNANLRNFNDKHHRSGQGI